MNAISNLLEGRKTYIGLVIALIGVLGLNKYVAEAELAELLNKTLEVVGLAMAMYGRYKAKP